MTSALQNFAKAQKLLHQEKNQELICKKLMTVTNNHTKNMMPSKLPWLYLLATLLVLRSCFTPAVT